MRSFKTTLIDRFDWAQDAAAFRFERPDGYSFVAGQYALLSLHTDEGPVTKPFTIASAPGDPVLEFTTRISSSAFKRTLAALVPGDPIEISVAAGRFVLPADAHRVVFLVGGVGITPARSILRDALQGNASLDATVFYGNRGPECVPYLTELTAMAAVDVRLVLVLERPDEGWTGEVGFITPQLVRATVGLDSAALWMVSGPPVMVEAMESVLDELGIPAEERMIERFGVKR
ncbi:MAG: FAD-dependent oxidoreductase [Actinomycetota bacterium]|nr:FAD-dependent oxidoreductase [Actinomycetota bacterium]